MFAERLRGRRQLHARALRAAALAVATLGAVALAVVVPPTPPAAAADENFATITPQGIVGEGNDSSHQFHLHYKVDGAPSHVAISINDNSYVDNVGVAEATYDLPSNRFDCKHDNTVRVDVDYSDGTPSRTQTLGGLAVDCPRADFNPNRVVGAGQTPIVVTRWDYYDPSGFDSWGPYTDPGKGKTLSVDGHQVGGIFGYRVEPTATADLGCGDHVVTLRQPGPYGELQASDTISVYCSTWSVAPHGLINTTGPSDITVSDTKTYRPGTVATVTIDGSDLGTPPQNKQLGVITPDANGHLVKTFSDDGYFQCPYDSNGSYSLYSQAIDVHISEPDPGPRLRFAAARVESDVQIPFRLLCPEVGVDHAFVDQAALPAAVTVTARNFADGSDAYDIHDLPPLAVLLDGKQIGTAAPTVDWTADVTWTGNVSASCGKHIITVAQPTDFGPAGAQTPFTVLCPQLALRPDVIASSSQPRAVAVQGAGFHPPVNHGEGGIYPQPYVLSVDGRQLGQGDTDDDGNIATSFTASSLPCGIHTVTITEQPPQSPPELASSAPSRAADPDPLLSASAPLTVNCPTPPPPPPSRPHDGPRPGGPRPGGPATPAAPTLAVNPRSVIAGLRTMVTGTGFAPGRTVGLTWTLPSGRTEPACPGTTAKAGSDGTFAVYCLVPQHDRLGRRHLTGTDGKGSAGADALIVSSTMQPSRGHNRLVIRR